MLIELIEPTRYKGQRYPAGSKIEIDKEKYEKDGFKSVSKVISDETVKQQLPVDPFAGLTVSRLKGICKKLEISGASNLSKNQLIQVIVEKAEALEVAKEGSGNEEDKKPCDGPDGDPDSKDNTPPGKPDEE